MAANGITDAEANAILDARIEAGTIVDLVTTMGTATAAPVKVTGGSYTAQTPTWAAAAAREKHNSATVTFAGMPDTSAAGGVKGIDLTHSAGAGGGRSWFMPFTSAKVTNAGDTLTFAASAISASLANGT